MDKPAEIFSAKIQVLFEMMTLPPRLGESYISERIGELCEALSGSVSEAVLERIFVSLTETVNACQVKDKSGSPVCVDRDTFSDYKLTSDVLAPMREWFQPSSGQRPPAGFVLWAVFAGFAVDNENLGALWKERSRPESERSVYATAVMLADEIAGRTGEGSLDDVREQLISAYAAARDWVYN